MDSEFEKFEAEVDKGYETFQIITDFDTPIEIFREAFQNSLDEDASQVYCRVYEEQKLGTKDLLIDIWDNGKGLAKENVPCFFGLAKSTKIDANKMPIGKLGYKGHGTKIFFNAERIEILSKPTKGDPGWSVVLVDPVKQIQQNGMFKYSDFIAAEKSPLKLPNDFDIGFFVRIRNHRCFKTEHTRYVLNHLYLRDYSKWFTVFGSIRPWFDKNVPEVVLYLSGLDSWHLKNDFNAIPLDPQPQFLEKNQVLYEKILAKHYFPQSRSDDKDMKAYVKKLGTTKPYYDFYSRQVYSDTVHLDNNVSFNFLVQSEGYETKRMYDILLSRRGHSTIAKELQHTDSERYGLWACKGGVPIQRIDEWIEGGRGMGTYTYLHAFVDCDSFDLTANRSSITNTDLEIQGKIKKAINEILSQKRIQNDLSEREEWERQEKTIRQIEKDAEELKDRFNLSKKRKSIVLPGGEKFPVPSTQVTGVSESETLILLMRLLEHFPGLFKFNLLDYNTTEGIDFVVEQGGYPKYVELKGTLKKKVNHSFRNIYKFICYDLDMTEGDIIEDVEEFKVRLSINKHDKFESFDDNFKNKEYTSYQLIPSSAVIQSMEIIVLKKLLQEVIAAKIE